MPAGVGHVVLALTIAGRSGSYHTRAESWTSTDANWLPRRAKLRAAVSNVSIVFPCFNEAKRLRVEPLLWLVRAQRYELVLVDDGSSDATPALLEQIRAAEPTRVHVMRFERNRGKAEAVRQGVLLALTRGAAIVGYADSDLSTPVDELARLIEHFANHDAAVIMGSRVALLGLDIQRSAVRHYVGRVFATAASLTLRLRVYDTQCGAKFFRATPALSRALARPFRSRWAFDVELLGRLLVGGAAAGALEERDFLEVPLQQWTHMAGSKLRLVAMLRAGADLAAIALDLAQERRAARTAASERTGAAHVQSPERPKQDH